MSNLEKALDRVNYKRLLQKLVKFGFGHKLVKWFYSYLTSCRQFVGIGERNSRTLTVSSGVPAGSILGPCLFVIFKNDIVDSITNAIVLLFADDLELMRKMTSPMDAFTFQRAIDQLYVPNRLHLNLKKCFVMTYARGKR